ncbi:hypothetical protein AMECASPLE_005855 [Ameca splendens]|uniref:Uncharacterized protein n=1 Tax=Ameca splendens TaxID=208324 RepID=A0ABV0YME1_9TELE
MYLFISSSNLCSTIVLDCYIKAQLKTEIWLCNSIKSLSAFYGRFDNHDFSAEHYTVIGDVVVEFDRMELDNISVNELFKQVDVNKATGPDGVFAFYKERW